MDTEFKKYNLAFGIILAVFLLFNLFTTKSYGITWDEPLQHHIGSVATDYIKGIADEVKFARSDEIYYGPFFEILNQYFGKWMMNLGFEYADAFHILIILASAFGLFFSYKLISALTNPRTALISCALLMLSPRFIAHSHFNPKDIPLFAEFVTSIYLLYSCFKNKKNSTAIWAGILIGFSLATRVDSILIFPVFFIPYILNLIIKKEWNIKKDFLLSGIILSSALVSAFIAWPILWKNPMILFRSFFYFSLRHDWNNNVLYFGKQYLATGLPWHYVLFYIFGTLSILVILPMIIGFFESTKRLKKQTLEYGILLCWPIIRILIALIPGSTRYDGMRHYIFILPALATFSAMGLEWTFKKIKQKKTIIIISAMIILWLLIDLFKIYPYGDSYFNEIVRMVYPKNMEEQFEIEYWGAPLREGIDWLNKNTKINSEVCVPFAEHLLLYYAVRKDIQIVCTEKPEYLMFTTRATFIPENLDEIYNYKNLDPVFKIQRHNSDLLLIYELK